MSEENEANNLIELNKIERDRHGKPVLNPELRRKNNWKKGVSGNPQGKPPGALRKETVLKEMMKYNMIVSPSLLRRSEAVLEKVLAEAETGDKDAQEKILRHVLNPFIKMQALKSAGVKGEARPVVNINITKADGMKMDGRGVTIDAD